MYGTVKNVAYEYYRDPEFGNVKTGRRLVFIDLYEGHGVPPFCIVRGQKISVSYRGCRPICFHCNVEGHMKAKCPIAKFKTCYNCGSPTHEHVECCEPTFVAYFFKENEKYPPFCYPTDYEPEDPEDETVYGLIQNVDEARVYNLTFDPYFYSPDPAVRYRQSTYDDTEQDQGNDKDENDEGDENIRGIWESDDEDTTESPKTTEHMETDSKEQPPQQETEKTDSTEKPKTKPTQKTKPSPRQPSTQPPNSSDPGASNKSPDLSPPSQPNPPQVTETHKKDPQTATKRKITTNSPKVEQKKTKDTTADTKDSTTKDSTVVITVKLAFREISISLEASHILKYLLVNNSGRAEFPAIEEQAQILDQENGRGQDIERLVLPKVGSKIRAYFKSLKRGQIIQQLIHDVRHILGQCKWAQ